MSDPLTAAELRARYGVATQTVDHWRRVGKIKPKLLWLAVHKETGERITAQSELELHKTLVDLREWSVYEPKRKNNRNPLRYDPTDVERLMDSHPLAKSRRVERFLSSS